MPSEPAEESVNTVEALTGLSRPQAVRYLKAKQNNPEAAINAYFEGEDISKAESATTWDDTLFEAGRDGEQNENKYLRPLTGSTPATRPNSPAPSGRSNLQPASKQEEDEDMARALAESQAEMGGGYVSFQQETGRIGADGQRTVFGPATKEHYESSQWAMVHVGSGTTNEIIPDVDVEQRQLMEGEPRMLKHQTSGDYLPNLLTICNFINGARNALLMDYHVSANYGQDADWWRGHPVVLPRIVHVEDGTPVEPKTSSRDDFFAETQRLMAFLGDSKRSYASIGALMQTQVMKNGLPQFTNSKTYLEVFLTEWKCATEVLLGAPLDYSGIFTTLVGANYDDGQQSPELTVIDMLVTIPEGSRSDLFEQLDGLLWDPDGKTDNRIDHPAEVLVMWVHQVGVDPVPQLRVEVPAELYVDKYLEENIDHTKSMRAEMVEARKRISKIDEIDRKLRYWLHPTKKPNEYIDAGVLLQHTAAHFSGANREEIIKADRDGRIPEEMKTNPPGHDDVANKLEGIISSIRHKLEILEEEKEKTRKALSEMSRAPPKGLKPEDLKHRYTLRGVATKPNITYVLCPEEPKEDQEMMDDETTPKGMRWWRLEYDASGAFPKVSKTKIADYDVIRAAELEHSSALLVYANDRVVNMAPDPLPAALQDFITQDNALFTTELEAERANPPSYPFSIDAEIPRESIERTSMDSTRVLTGGDSDNEEPSPPSYEQDGFMDGAGFGLGPQVKRALRRNAEDDDGEVHEITLEDLDEIDDEGIDVGEMQERPHQPLLAGSVAPSSDTLMEESQDMGDAGLGAKLAEAGKKL